MTFVSYAQNYEDLRLWRSLKNIDRGCYLDVGAQHPIFDSVSKAFYELGWRGAHIEPTSAYASALREDRPDEAVFEVALGQPGKMTFYEFPETGMSTGVAEIARMHSEAGFAVRLREVPVVPLSKIFADLAAETIHWMKIDVEGMERDIISSWGQSPAKPWVLVIESVHPSTHEPTEGEWLNLVLARGYREVAFDGLSRYFVAEEHAELATALATPPNIFDDFTVTRYHFSVRGVAAEYASTVADLEASVARLEAETNAVHLRIEELESGTAALSAERANLETELAAERANAAGLAAELKYARETFVIQLAAETANVRAMEAELERRILKTQEQVAAAEQERERIAGELEHRILKMQEQVVAAEQERDRIAVKLNESISESRDRLAALEQEHDRILQEAQAHRSAAVWADALIRNAVQSRPGPLRQLGEAIGLVRPRRSWQALADWSLPVTSSFSSESHHHNEADPVLAMNAISTISRRNPYLRANSLEELLSWDDANFIRCAYVTLLGRQPDPDGEAFYLGRIRRGHSKLEVLWQLRRSTEAREHDPGVAGLDRALKRAAWARKPVIGRVVQALYGTEGNSPDERRHRVLLREVRALRRELVVMRNAEPAPPNEHAGHGEPGTATPPAPQRLPREQEKPKQSEARLSKDKCDHDIGLSPLPDSAIAAEDANKVKYIVYAVGHTATCSVNTGVQRVVRQLSKAFLKNGEQLLFVKWNENQRDFELLTTEELDHLSEWSGPTADQILSHGRYQAANGEPVFLGQVDWANMEWIFFPEVHHLGTEDHEVTLNQINAARALKLKTAAIFYDAIPLRRRELKTMAAMHEAYMRQLMEMDLVFPISNAAARDLELFLQSYEGIDRERLPPIRPMLLPAEMPERSRGQAKREHRQTVLCVGSIDERKNQLLLAQAFADLSRENQINGWTLKLVGNCNPELHLQLTEIIDNCPSIEWLGPIPDEALRAVYDDVAFCVFPSIDEGFGLPIAESLWMGKPCICANFGSMAEVAEAGGCLTVDTTDMSSLKLALEQLMLNPKQLKRLQKEVSSADLGTWSDYAAELRRHMDEVAHGAELLGPIYYVAEQTAEFPGNTGIQRVTRGLANALLGIGVPLIAAKWNAGTNGLEPLSADELNHLAKFNGPSVDAWASWEQPGGSVRTRWVLLPELTPHFSPGDYDAMRSFMDQSGLRAAWIFYDTVPWKLKGLYAEGAAIAHSNYMRGLNKFELILAISSHSRDELRKYYVSQPEPTVDLAHRLSACVLPGEFKERPRTSEPASRHKGALRILSVGTIEARKNHITLVRAFLKAKPMFRREARLVLAGSSPFPDVFAPIQELIASSGAVDWIEQPTDDKLDQLYRDCDFTVYPSIEEGFGLPIVESAWYGKPCITANRGAMREAAVGGGCLLVDVSNVDALASALVRLVNSESFRLALAEEACNRPVKTWEDYAKEIVAKLIDDTPPAQPTAHCQSFGVDWQHTFSNLAQRPLLSICITTYNRADWLKRSLGAVLEACAGNEHSVEIVVCDNASTDHTPKVVRDFTGAALLRYHRNARNVGMLGNLLVSSQKARGEYIWIVGDDDLIMPQGVSNVLEALKANPGVSLVYTNYAYTREDDPEKADDLNEFFTTSTPIAEGGESFVGQTKDVALRNENFFTAIYCIVFRRDHGLRAYGQYTGGEPFSSLPTCVPTTNYILKNIMGDQAVWLAEPQLVVNLNVSWMKYAWRWILERFPEIHDTAVRNGADPVQVDRWRTEHLPSMVHFLGDAYSSPEGGRSEFDLQRLILDLKHLERYPEFREDFLRAYSAAALARHPAAKFGLDELFAGYSS